MILVDFRYACRLSLALSAITLLFAAPSKADWTALSKLSDQGARVSALAVDLPSGEVLDALHASTRLTPASLSKLVITAAALEHWPVDKVFETRLLAESAPKAGRVQGDLILEGGGDAAMDHQTLAGLASQLRSAGVRAVSGGLRVYPALYAPPKCETKDRCDAMLRSDTAYHSPLSPVGTDYGSWCVDVIATEPGAAARLAACGGGPLPIPVVGTIKTATAKKSGQFRVERRTTADGDALHIGGAIKPRTTGRVYVAMSNPAQAVGLLLRQRLRELGIEIPGPVRVVQTPPPAHANVLAKVESLALREQLGRMMRHSNNYIADVLTLNLATELAPDANISLAGASRNLMDFMRRHAARDAAEWNPPLLLSGSGLTPGSLLSADDLTRLLADQFLNSRNFPAFYGSLVVPRFSPSRVLSHGSEDWLDRAAIKTGGMNDPHSVFGIAGYLRRQDGGWIAFAVIVNGSGKLLHIPYRKAARAAQTDIEALLKRY